MTKQPGRPKKPRISGHERKLAAALLLGGGISALKVCAVLELSGEQLLEWLDEQNFFTTTRVVGDSLAEFQLEVARAVVGGSPELALIPSPEGKLH